MSNEQQATAAPVAGDPDYDLGNLYGAFTEWLADQPGVTNVEEIGGGFFGFTLDGRDISATIQPTQ